MNRSGTSVAPPAARPSTAAAPEPRGAAFDLAGETAVADPAGVLWLPARKVLVVADLHFEKGSWYGERGQFLPPYDTRETLRRLSAVVGRLGPESIVSLGDAFHDARAEERIGEEDAAALEALCSGCDWTWIAGNHDPSPPARFGGRVCEELRIGALVLRHEPAEGPGDAAFGEVGGHLHPVAKVRRPGRSVRRRCFATDGRRILLPAFGAYAGGLNVRDPAIRGLFPSGVLAMMLGAARVYPVQGRELVAD